MIDNYAAIINGNAMRAVEDCILWYDRRLDGAPVPEGLRKYVTGEHHLFLKQVPSCLTLRRAGSKLSSDTRKILIEDGFPILQRSLQFLEEIGDIEEAVHEEYNSSGQFHSSEEDSEELDYDPPVADIQPSGISYEDPFKIFAGYAYALQNSKETPSVFVWPQGCHRLQGKIHPSLCNIDGKNSLHFTTMESHEARMYLLMNHTHWGYKINHARKWVDPLTGDRHPLRFFAETLHRRISFLLQGRFDPVWTKPERSRYLADPDRKRNRKERSRRFLEVLKTVDGMFLQRFLAFPEETWDWEKYDLFVLQSLSIVISDEFFDGELTPEGMSQKTFYAELKSARKTFKSVIHKDEPDMHDPSLGTLPRWVLSFYREIWRHAIRLNGFQRLYAAGILSQTRGAGTPPPLVVIQSKEKFLKSISEEPPRLSRTESALISRALDIAIGKVPGEAFTGLDTKARVTVTGSACWEETRKEGGTAQAVLQILKKYEDTGLEIPVRNMTDGSILFSKKKDDFESVGTAIFHACLQEVLEGDPKELGDVFLTLVKEPGKARVVTKGHAALKIVLDTISKICSWPLKKGFKSSESGMGRSHHGWNLFRDFFSEEFFEDVFHEDRERRTEIQFADYIQRHIVWDDIFAGSTDYREATDRMIHEFAEPTACKWMTKCGIPPLLQGIVRAVCFRPRRIFFTGTGALQEIGVQVEGTTRMVTLKRGVLMGDPLTKVILHFSNIAAREMASSLTDGQIFARFLNGAQAAAIYASSVIDAYDPTLASQQG